MWRMENGELLFSVFLSIIIREHPIYLAGRKSETNKGSHFSHIIKYHAELNCGAHYHRMLWRSKVQKVSKGIQKFSCRIDQRLHSMIVEMRPTVQEMPTTGDCHK